ncbi:hypothetical protein KBD08_00575 [Candidatus Babeliales bacterium]|nr:hypothetical protein [Candidatus Babeliales bacterium]
MHEEVSVKEEPRVRSIVDEEEYEVRRQRRNEEYEESERLLKKEDEERAQYWEELALKKRKKEQEKKPLNILNDQINNYWKAPERLKYAHLVTPLDQAVRRANVTLDQSFVQSDFKKEIVFVTRDIDLENKLILALSIKRKPLLHSMFQENLLLHKRQPMQNNSLKEDIISVHQHMKHNNSQDDTITVFIPTREYYQQNQEMFSVPLKCNGYPVFIPDRLKIVSQSSMNAGNSGTPCHLGNSCGNGGFFDPKLPKDDNDSPLQTLLNTVAMVALGMCSNRSAMIAEFAGLNAVMTVGSAMPIVVGGVVIGYLTKMILPGCKTPILCETARNTKNMSKEELSEYIKAKKIYDALIEQENIIFLAEMANKIACQNGVYVKGSSSDPVIDDPIVDPRLNYHLGHGQRLLDLSTSVAGSNDRYSFHNGKVIKFTCTSAWYDPTKKKYSAAVVDDLTVLSKADKKLLRRYYGFNVNHELYLQKKKRERQKQELKNFEKDRKKRENDANRGNNSDPDKDPKKDPKGKGVVADAAANEAKKKVMKYTGSPKHHENSKGKASKAPHHGQKVLDNSILVKTKGNQGLETRVGVENGEVVKFQEQAPCQYHGYIVEENLDQDSINTLIAAGLMRTNGKLK